MPNSAGVEVARISVKVSPDTRQFRKDLKSDLEEIERTMKGDIEFNAHLSDGQAKADMRRLLAQLKTEAAKGVNVPVDINVDRDRKGGLLDGLLGGGGGGLGDLGEDAEKASSQVQHLGKSFLGLTRTGWLAVGVLAIAAPLVGLIAGLLAGLPSLIGAFGAGIGVVALGIDGIKAAAEPLIPVLDGVKAAVSSTFQTGLTPVFQQLGPLLTAITPNLQNVASGLISMAGAVTDVVTQAPGLQQIQNILDKSGEFFAGLGPVLATGTQAFLGLANAGANSFGTLLAPLQQFSDGFNEIVQRVTSNGVFESAMQGLSQTLGSLLNLFNRLFESGLQAIGQLGGPLSTFINGFGDLFIALMPALTSVSSLLGNVFGTLGTQLAPVVTALTPAFTTLASTLGTLLTGALQSLGPILTQVAGLIGTTLNTALQTLQPLLPGLMAGFQQISTVLVESLGPQLPALGEAFGQIVGAVLQLAPTIIGSLIPAFTTLIPAVAQLIPPFTSLVSSVTKMLPVIIPVVQTMFSLAGAVAAAGAAIAGGLISALSTLLGKFAETYAAIAEWVASFANGAQQIAAKAAELPGLVSTALSNLVNIGLEAGKDLVRGLINGIGEMISSAVNKAKELASSVAGAVKGFLGIHSPSKLFEQFGIFTGQGYAIGLDKGFAPVLEQAKDLASQVAAAVATGTEDPTSLLRGYSKQDVNRLEKVLNTEIKKYERQAKALDLQAKTTGNDGLKAEADRLREMKEQLQTQKEMLDLAGDFNDETSKGASLEEQVGHLLSEPVDFAKSAGKTFLSDIGIGGDGFISKALTEGTKYIFQIGSVDEALSIKDREESKNALSVVGRQ
ncbi:tape measure protein [Mycobacterium phage Koko]|uniref:Tape measure protein n=1 Tax=Mycobacterium phage Koko TaxID=2047840 RepID=A0A2H4PDX8_9CAUD|nr:tail length tape measure protein [Mycobacterium phage Koko]ATW60319.1 tape measure protein [Mycobacterium phage Koko]